MVEDGDGEIRGSACPASFDFYCSVFDDLFATDLVDWQVAKESLSLIHISSPRDKRQSRMPSSA